MYTRLAFKTSEPVVPVGRRTYMLSDCYHINLRTNLQPRDMTNLQNYLEQTCKIAYDILQRLPNQSTNLQILRWYYYLKLKLDTILHSTVL